MFKFFVAMFLMISTSFMAFANQPQARQISGKVTNVIQTEDSYILTVQDSTGTLVTFSMNDLLRMDPTGENLTNLQGFEDGTVFIKAVAVGNRITKLQSVSKNK